MTKNRHKTVECRFPCGGVLRIDWSHIVNAGTAGFVDQVDEAVMPELRCNGRYRPGEGCPWIERLGKFCRRGIALENAAVNAKSPARELKTEVKYDQGRRTTVYDCKPNSGTVLSGTEIFEDARFWAVCYKANERPYECEKKVGHGSIIAFLKWFFGWKGKR